MTQCPDHPGTLGATLGNCNACRRETTPAQDAARHADLVRRQVRHVRTTPPATPATDDRARIDALRDAIDKETRNA